MRQIPGSSNANLICAKNGVPVCHKNTTSLEEVLYCCCCCNIRVKDLSHLALATTLNIFREIQASLLFRVVELLTWQIVYPQTNNLSQPAAIPGTGQYHRPTSLPSIFPPFSQDDQNGRNAVIDGGNTISGPMLPLYVPGIK